jgi:hypothetical protein
VSRWTPWERRDDWRDEGRRHRPAKAWLTTLVWRCRYELVMAGGATAAMIRLVDAVGPHRTVAITLVAVLGGGSVPRVRQASGLVWWHVVTPHLFRHACGDLGIVNSRGRVPALLRTRTRHEAQYLTVWCWASASVIDLHKARDELATGMHAQAVSVHRHRRYGQIAVVTVIRDDRRLLDRNGSGDDDRFSWHDLGDGDEVAFRAIPRQRGPRLGAAGGVA